MSSIFRPLLIASAIGVMSLGAQAQPGTTTPSTAKPDQAAQAQPATTTPSTTKTPEQAFSDYQAARDACGAKSGLAKSDCLRNARDDYERVLNASGGAIPNGGGGGGGYGGPSGNSGAGGGKANKS
jgi:hypothetical protein